MDFLFNWSLPGVISFGGWGFGLAYVLQFHIHVAAYINQFDITFCIQLIVAYFEQIQQG